MDTSKMTKTQLLDKCKELKIIKCNSKSKTELIEFIRKPSTKKRKLKIYK